MDSFRCLPLVRFQGHVNSRGQVSNIQSPTPKGGAMTSRDISGTYKNCELDAKVLVQNFKSRHSHNLKGRHHRPGIGCTMHFYKYCNPKIAEYERAELI